MIFKFTFIVNIIYMVERDACPHGSPVRIGRVETQRKMGGTHVSIFVFLLCLGDSFSWVGIQEGTIPCSQTASSLHGVWGRSFNDALETLMGRRAF